MKLFRLILLACCAALLSNAYGAPKLRLDPQEIGQIRVKGGSYFLFTGRKWGWPKDCPLLEHRAVFETNRGARLLGCVSIDSGEESAYVRIKIHGQPKAIVFDIGDVEW